MRPVNPSEERTWAILVHLSILLNLVSGLLGLLPPFILWLIYRDRSRYVAYHSLQALVFQLIFWVGGGAIGGIAWVITSVLSTVLVGLLCVPISLLLSLIPVGALVYGVVGAIQCSGGKDFRYWLVGDWTRGTLTG